MSGDDSIDPTVTLNCSISFIFTLQEFTAELVSLVDAMSRIYAAERASAKAGPWFKRIPSQLFTCLRSRVKGKERSAVPKAGRPSFPRRICTHPLPLCYAVLLTMPLPYTLQRNTLTQILPESRRRSQRYGHTRRTRCPCPRSPSSRMRVGSTSGFGVLAPAWGTTTSSTPLKQEVQLPC